MRKFCVFCGKKPVDKNKEHVIPQWLIKYTGDPNRITNLGTRDGKKLKITWLNFVFPACEDCNSRFAEIESRVRVILIKLDRENLLSHEELDLFLDWLDKVRTGMWLGHAMIQNKDFEPNFFINTRVGTKDRICLIYKLQDNEKGIGIIGSDTPVFANTPSCFTLIINDMVFFNYSKEFLLGENLGFPYPTNFSYSHDGKLDIEKIAHGKYIIEFPIIEGKIIKPAVKFYQSILSGPHMLARPVAGSGRVFYNANAMTFINNKIKSRIYVSNEQDDAHGFWMKNKTNVFKFKEKFDRTIFLEVIAKITLEHQNISLRNSMQKYIPSSDEDKYIADKYYNSLLDINNNKILEIDKMIGSIFTVI